jgi:hypothetical protein
MSLGATGLHSTMLAAGQGQAVTLTGRAMGSDMQPLPNGTVRLRNVTTGELERVTTSGQGGGFSFPAIDPDTYVVELTDRTGRLLGTSAPFRVEANTAPTMSVVATAPTAIAASSSAGFSLLGLGSTMSTIVLGSAGAAAITAVVATRPEASPSR